MQFICELVIKSNNFQSKAVYFQLGALSVYMNLLFDFLAVAKHLYSPVVICVLVTKYSSIYHTKHLIFPTRKPPQNKAKLSRQVLEKTKNSLQAI